MLDVPGPVPPCGRVGSPEEEAEMMEEAGEEGAAAVESFVRTSSTISNLKLCSQQRPKSWAGNKREEEEMKERNIDLYFKSLLSEQQKALEDDDNTFAEPSAGAAAAAAAAASSLPYDSVATVAVSTSVTAVSMSVTAVHCRQQLVGVGVHRRATQAKSLDLSSTAGQHDHSQQFQYQPQGATQRQAPSIYHARTGSNLSEGSSAELQMLSSRQMVTVGSISPDMSHTPIADLQPTAQQIETVVIARLGGQSPTGISGDGAMTGDGGGPMVRSSSVSSASPNTSRGDSPSHATTSPLHFAAGPTASNASTLSRVRDQVANIEAAQKASGSESEALATSPPPGDVDLSRHYEAAKAHAGLVRSSTSDSLTSRSSSKSPVRVSGKSPVRSASKSPVRSEAAVSAAAVTVVERPRSASAARHVSVESRPQIKSVHRRVESIEKFQVFSPIDSPASASQSATSVGVPATENNACAASREESAEAVQRSSSPVLPSSSVSANSEAHESTSSGSMGCSEQSVASSVVTTSTEPTNSLSSTGLAPVIQERRSHSICSTRDLPGQVADFPSFAGFSSGSSGSVVSDDTAQQAPSPKVSRLSLARPGGRAMSLSSASRRVRATPSPYTWQKPKSPSLVEHSSPGQSPVLRRTADGLTRHSPQTSRHRTFSFMSPKAQRRALLSSCQNEENFVTFIPSRRPSSEMKHPSNFQSLLEQFRGMSQPKGQAATDGSTASSPPTSSSQQPIDSGIQPLSTAMEA